MIRRASLVALLIVVACAPWARARPQPGDGCGRAVIFTVPGVTWQDVARARPPNLLGAIEDGSAAALAVRTNTTRTSYAAGFATLGGGTRLDGGITTGGLASPGETAGAFSYHARASGVAELEELAVDAGYGGRPGALGTALGSIPSIAVGNADPGQPLRIGPRPGRWTLLAAMNTSGVVPLSATGPQLLEPAPGEPFGVRTDSDVVRAAVDRALRSECATLVVDHGDPTRADAWATILQRPLNDVRDEALLRADDLLGFVRSRLDPARDLLLVLSPTSPAWDPEVHLGIAVAVGPGFPAGTTMQSARTRQERFVTLPDVAPTVLGHFGISLPPSMVGRRFVSVPASGDRVAALAELDREAVFSHQILADVATAFVVVQVAIYLLTIVLLWRREKRGPSDHDPRLRTLLEIGALAVVAFPVTQYLASPIQGHEIGIAGLVTAFLAIDAAIVAGVSIFVSKSLYRFLVITAATFGVLVVDLFMGGRFQLMAVWGNDPINAGRFSGIGNLAFAVLGTSSLLTAALLFHRWRGGRRAIAVTLTLFVLTVIADGAPQLGSDVGGVLALVPALAVTFLLLTGRRPSWRMFLVSVAAGLVVLGLFLLVDLARPAESQTHLGRFVEDIRARGPDVFLDTIERKVTTNVRVFRSTIWTYLVPVALALIGYLLLRPRGRWRSLAETYPRLRAGLIGALILGVLGFAVNDSGIVVPAMVLSFLVPLALLIHLQMEREGPPEQAAPT